MIAASGGHGWALAIFPLAAAAIAAAFGGVLLRRFASRHRPHEGVWTVALFMYAGASFAMFLGVVSGWTPGAYRVYWLLGAALNVAFLAVGEVYLLARSRMVGHLALTTVVVVSILSTVVVWSSELNARFLEEVLPLGKEVWGTGAGAYRLSWISWVGYVGLLAGLVWSAYRMRGDAAARSRTAGVLIIAAGATIVAIGSGVGAGFEVVPLFSTALAFGIAVMFWGFLRTTVKASAPKGPGLS